MSYTNATVIIAAADQAAAQVDFPGSFTAGLSETGEAPATHYVCSGLWTNSDLSRVTNECTWPKRVYFGDISLEELGLKAVQPGEPAEPTKPALKA